jgi:peptidoglycan hydrolase CwlO-like protein
MQVLFYSINKMDYLWLWFTLFTATSVLLSILISYLAFSRSERCKIDDHSKAIMTLDKNQKIIQNEIRILQKGFNDVQLG